MSCPTGSHSRWRLKSSTGTERSRHPGERVATATPPVRAQPCSTATCCDGSSRMGVEVSKTREGCGAGVLRRESAMRHLHAVTTCSRSTGSPGSPTEGMRTAACLTCSPARIAKQGTVARESSSTGRSTPHAGRHQPAKHVQSRPRGARRFDTKLPDTDVSKSLTRTAWGAITRRFRS